MSLCMSRVSCAMPVWTAWALVKRNRAAAAQLAVGSWQLTVEQRPATGSRRRGEEMPTSMGWGGPAGAGWIACRTKVFRAAGSG